MHDPLRAKSLTPTESELEDVRECLAMLRALARVRIISGVRCMRAPVLYIDARLPQDG